MGFFIFIKDMFLRVRPFQLLCLTSDIFLSACVSTSKSNLESPSKQYVRVLGIAQDAGYPHINNPKEF